MEKMSDTETNPHAADLLKLTADIVAAHVGHSTVEPASLPGLVRSVFDALSSTATPATVAPKQEPVVPIKRSVFPDYIVCLEDGKKLKMLKRHLQSTYGMTPKEYREKWGLPSDYPLVAPNYASRRAALARQIGLGRVISNTQAAPVASPAPSNVVEGVPVTQVPARRRGRPAKAR